MCGDVGATDQGAIAQDPERRDREGDEQAHHSNFFS